MTLNIFGREHTILLLDQKAGNRKFADNEAAKEACGYTTYLKKEIAILERKCGEKMDGEMIEQTIGHEIGHVVERYAVYSTREFEGTSSAFEVVPTLVPQVQRILKEMTNGCNNS